MSGLLDELLKEPEAEEKKPQPVGKFDYSDQFTEYAKDKAAVGGEKKDE